MNAPTVSQNVAQRFHELRRRYLGIRLGIAFAIAITVLAGLWITFSAIDYVWEWSATWRKATAILGAVLITVWLVHRIHTIIRDTRQRRFAAQLEQEFDGFGQRVRTVLETVEGRVDGPEEMLTALGHQTLGRWETLTPSKMIPNRSLLTAGVLGLAGLVFTAGLFMSGGEWKTAMRRAVGQSVPYTQMSVTPGSHRVLEGTPMGVSLQLTGRTNRDVTLRYRHMPLADEIAAAQTQDQPLEEPQWIETNLLPSEPSEHAPNEGETPNEDETVDKRKRSFDLALGKAERPVEYQFVTSIGTTDVYRLDVQPLIEAERIETTVKPPTYTRLQERTFTSKRVSVLQRSNVQVTIQTNHPLSKVTLETGKKSSQLQPIEINPGDDPSQWTFELPSENSIHWKFSGNGVDGTPMKPVKGRLKVRFDSPPKLSWNDPPDEIKVHTLTEVPMRVHVADDYGVTESGIVFQLGDEEYTLTEWEMESVGDESAGANPKVTTRVRLEEILPLESFALSERDYIGYYAYAVDNREFGPHRTESDIRYLDIRPLRQFYNEIELEPGEGGAGRVLVQLDEIIRRQRFLINRTVRLVRASSDDVSKQLGTIDRMVESESELAGLTRFLAEFFISRGNDDVEALNQAESAMLQASDSLAAGSFDLALGQEKEALQALAEARRTLEITLIKNASRQQQAALRRLARQLRQKLRREPPETEQQLADSIQRVAMDQRLLGQTAMKMAKSQNNSQSNMTASGTSGKPNPDTPNSSETNSNESDLDKTENENTSKDDGQTGDEKEPGTPEEQESDSGSDSGDDEKEMSAEEMQEELYARQIDLAERMQAIEEALADRLSKSPLMSDRMQDAKASMDELSAAARDGELERLAGGSRDLAEQLKEIGLQLQALAATEPVSRISSVRDLTASMGKMEQELSQELQNSGTGQASPKDEMDRLKTAMKRRAETIEDVLNAPTEVGDVASSEVNDRLQELADENEFMDQLAESKDAIDQLPKDDAKNPSEAAKLSDQAQQRAIEYLTTSQLLDELYQQMVAPRLNRIRKIERQASKLAQRMQGKRGTPNGGTDKMDESEAKAGLRLLKQQLQSEGFQDLADLLSEEEISDEEIEEMLESRFKGGSIDQKGITNLKKSGFGRVSLVVAKLQAQIQEMILLEISADRDAPVPTMYRRAVDGYFRTLAGDAKTLEYSSTAGDSKTNESKSGESMSGRAMNGAAQ